MVFPCFQVDTWGIPGDGDAACDREKLINFLFLPSGEQCSQVFLFFPRFSIYSHVFSRFLSSDQSLQDVERITTCSMLMSQIALTSQDCGLQSGHLWKHSVCCVPEDQVALSVPRD